MSREVETEGKWGGLICQSYHLTLQICKGCYHKGAYTVTDFKYHFVWKTRYSYGILKGKIGLGLRDIIREICTENSLDIIKGDVLSNHIYICLSGVPFFTG